jgi:hypothetical protein
VSLKPPLAPCPLHLFHARHTHDPSCATRRVRLQGERHTKAQSYTPPTLCCSPAAVRKRTPNSRSSS